MSSDATAVIIAIVGVFGTLAWTIASQYLTSRSKRSELAFQDKIRNDERKRDDDRERLEAKRSWYAQFMATARSYRMEIQNLLYAASEQPDRQHLEEARRAFIVSFAEAQLVASPDVLSKIKPFNFGLTGAYENYASGQLGTGVISGNAFEVVNEQLNDIWDNQWNAMRESMRQDLSAQDLPSARQQASTSGERAARAGHPVDRANGTANSRPGRRWTQMERVALPAGEECFSGRRWTGRFLLVMRRSALLDRHGASDQPRRSSSAMAAAGGAFTLQRWCGIVTS